MAFALCELPLPVTAQRVTGLQKQSPGVVTTAFPHAIGRVFPQSTKRKAAPVHAAESHPIEPDWQTSFATESDFNAFKVIDANNDGKTWGWNDAYDGSARSEYNDNNGNDDWLITPPLHLLPGRQYILTFKIRNAATNWTNTFEVKYGKGATPDSLDQTLVETYTPSGEDFETQTVAITPESEGTYYIGFHDNTAEAGRYWLFLDDISIEKGPVGGAPAAVENLTITPAPRGELSADISFTAPSQTIDGSTLNQIDSFQVSRDGTPITTLGQSAAGETVTVTDDDVKSNGYHTYQIVPFLGNEGGGKAKASAYIGLDIPKDPDNVKLLANGNNILAQWQSSPETGANNGYVNPADVSLSFYELEQTMYGVSVGAQVAESEKGDTSLILEQDPEQSIADDGVSQSLYQLAARADNSAGSSSYHGTHPIVIGPSISLPFRESLSHGHLDNGFVWTEGNDQRSQRPNPAGWMLANDNSYDNDGGSLRWAPYSVEGYFGTTDYDILPGDEASMNMPKVAFADAVHPKLYFSLYATAGEQARLRVNVETPDAVEHELKVFDLSTTEADGWSRQSIDLSQFAGQRSVIVKFTGICDGDNTNIGIDDINIFDQLENNLAVTSLSTPKSIVAGKTGTATVTVRNYGANDASGWSVVLYENDQPVDTVASSTTLAVLESDTLKLSFPVAINQESPVNVKAAVVYTGDLNDKDDVSDVKSVRVRQSGYAPVADLSANEGAGGTVDLSWSKPSIPLPTSVTETFEDYDAFSTELGDWTLIDGDGGAAGAFFSNYSYPGQGDPMAFFAFNPESITDAFDVVGSNPGLTPKSGNQFAGAPYAVDASGNSVTADNWLITPELSGNSQTVKFYAFNVASTDGYGWTSVYNETFDVLYSTTGRDVADFQSLGSFTADGQNLISESPNWKEISVDVPEGAKYVAIHHTTDPYNSFLFGVDDVTMETSVPGSNDSITAYNIYRDGELIATVESPSKVFTDEPVTGSHVYNVTAIYTASDGSTNESPFSNNASVVVTKIQSVNADGADAHANDTWYNVAGQRVSRNYRGIVISKGKKIVR